MTSSPYLGDGWREALAAEQRRATERAARPNNGPIGGTPGHWRPPPWTTHEITAADVAEPEVVSEEDDPEQPGAVLKRYDDGSVWRVYTTFNPMTERYDQQVYERVEPADN